MDEVKLRALIRHARKYCPYYVFLPPLQIREPINGYFKKIPLLSRQTVQSQHTRLLSLKGDTNGWRKVQTTGRTGEPIKVILSQEAQAVDAVLLSLHIDRLLGSTEWRRGRMYHLTLHAGSSSRTIHALWHDEGWITKWNLVRAWQESDQKFYEALAIIQDCVVTMMPSVAELMCARMQNINEKNIPRPLLILLSGEMVSTELKSKVSATFGCPVSSLYTMAEVGIIGSEQPGESSYQVEEKSAIVEILNGDGESLLDGQEGELVVTPLNNYAMPLIRYRTGDRGYWVDSKASPPVFRIVDARRPKLLRTSDGKFINSVRFAKIMASLGLDDYGIDQHQDGSIAFSYASRLSNITEENLNLIKTVIRGSLGPGTEIKFHKVTNSTTLEAGTRIDTVDLNQVNAEPLGPDIPTITKWLRERLQDVHGIEYACLTGSSLDPGSTTRFSDIDLNIMVQNDPDNQKWINLGRELKSHIPRLSCNFDTLIDFSKRAPLLTVRLLSEQVPLFAILNESVLPRPPRSSICLNGLYWTQEAIAIISHRTTDTTRPIDQDPIFESWLVAKWILTSLRYKYVASGEKNTSTKTILDRLQFDQDVPVPWKADLTRIVNISREIAPPPYFDQNEFEDYAKLATSFIRLTQRYLMEILESE